MNSIISFLKNWAESTERRERERREAYLAQSTDIYDLEYRLRELDREFTPPWMSAANSQ